MKFVTRLWYHHLLERKINIIKLLILHIPLNYLIWHIWNFLQQRYLPLPRLINDKNISKVYAHFMGYTVCIEPLKYKHAVYEISLCKIFIRFCDLHNIILCSLYWNGSSFSESILCSIEVTFENVCDIDIHTVFPGRLDTHSIAWEIAWSGSIN